MDGWTDIGTLRGPRGPKNEIMTVSDSGAFRPTGSHLMVPGDHHPHWLSVLKSDLHFLNRSYIRYSIYLVQNISSMHRKV